MAKLSRNARKKARTKRSISTLGRTLRTLQADYIKTQTMLLAVLAQRGGSVTITAGTLQQVLPKLSRIGWESAPVEGTEGEWEIRIVEQDTPEAAGDVQTDELVEPFIGTGIDTLVTDELVDGADIDTANRLDEVAGLPEIDTIP